MNKQDKKALEELQAYLASRNEKTNRQSDKFIIAQKNKPPKSEAAKKALIETVSKPEFKESQRKKTLEKNKDPEYKKNQRNGFNKRSENLEWLENNRIASAKRFEDPSFCEKFQTAMDKRSSNQKWRTAQKEKAKKQWKPVLTNLGPFKRFGDAVKHFMPIWNLKKGGADYRLRQYLNDPLNKEFKWISVEEYIMLTGKEL